MCTGNCTAIPTHNTPPKAQLCMSTVLQTSLLPCTPSRHLPLLPPPAAPRRQRPAL
jgi:hypothetical protein